MLCAVWLFLSFLYSIASKQRDFLSFHPLLSMLNRFPLVLCPLSVWVNVLFQHVLGLASEYMQYTVIA